MWGSVLFVFDLLEIHFVADLIAGVGFFRVADSREAVLGFDCEAVPTALHRQVDEFINFFGHGVGVVLGFDVRGVAGGLGNR